MVQSHKSYRKRSSNHIRRSLVSLNAVSWEHTGSGALRVAISTADSASQDLYQSAVIESHSGGCD